MKTMTIKHNKADLSTIAGLCHKTRKYESKFGGVNFEFRGTKEQLLPIIAMWDAHSRDEEELEDALKNWDGGESSLWEIIG